MQLVAVILSPCQSLNKGEIIPLDTTSKLPRWSLWKAPKFPGLEL